MAETVIESDVRSLLEVLEAARSEDSVEGMPVAVLEQLSQVVACDSLTFTELDVHARQVVLDQTVGDQDPGEDDDDAAFWRHYWDCLPCSYPDRSHDERRITTVSDFYSRTQFHSTGMYVEYLSSFMEYEAMMCMPAPAGRSRRLILFRASGPEFDDRDRALLQLLRPNLAEVYRELEQRRSPVAHLTARQRELLVLVARGYSNAQIGRALSISPGTVRKHLENIFQRLSVPSRAAAAALVAPMLTN